MFCMRCWKIGGNYFKDVIDFVIDNNYKWVKGNHEYLYERDIINAIEKGIKSIWSEEKRYGGPQMYRKLSWWYIKYQ